MLLLFDTHAGGNLTDDSFKSHLSMNPLRLHVHKYKKVLETRESLEEAEEEEDWRNVLLYLGMVVMILFTAVI